MNQMQKQITKAITVTPDRDAIIAVVRAETEAFLAYDYQRWAECWVQNERTQEVYTSGSAGIYIIKGWADISAHMKRVFEKCLVCKVRKFSPLDYHINISGDMAWVIYEEMAEFADGRT